MEEWVKWLIGLIVGLIFSIASLIAGIVVRDRQVFKAIKEGDDVLHARITRMKDDYVSRQELADKFDRLHENEAYMRERIDGIYKLLTERK